MFLKRVHIDTWQHRVFIQYNCYYFVINITIKCSYSHRFLFKRARLSLCCVHTDLIISLISSATSSKLLHSLSIKYVFHMRDSNNNCLTCSWDIMQNYGDQTRFVYDVLHWYRDAKLKCLRFYLFKRGILSPDSGIPVWRWYDIESHEWKCKFMNISDKHRDIGNLNRAVEIL